MQKLSQSGSRAGSKTSVENMSQDKVRIKCEPLFHICVCVSPGKTALVRPR